MSTVEGFTQDHTANKLFILQILILCHHFPPKYQTWMTYHFKRGSWRVWPKAATINLMLHEGLCMMTFVWFFNPLCFMQDNYMTLKISGISGTPGRRAIPALTWFVAGWQVEGLSGWICSHSSPACSTKLLKAAWDGNILVFPRFFT